MATRSDFQTVDEYIGTFPADVQEGLESIRRTIRTAVPDAEEVISYQIPAYKYHGMLMYFSAYKSHYSLSCPPPFKIFEVFKEPLSAYEVSKSAIKLPMDKPLPLDLVRDLVLYRANENKESSAKKKK